MLSVVSCHPSCSQFSCLWFQSSCVSAPSSLASRPSPALSCSPRTPTSPSRLSRSSLSSPLDPELLPSSRISLTIQLPSLLSWLRSFQPHPTSTFRTSFCKVLPWPLVLYHRSLDSSSLPCSTRFSHPPHVPCTTSGPTFPPFPGDLFCQSTLTLLSLVSSVFYTSEELNH